MWTDQGARSLKRMSVPPRPAWDFTPYVHLVPPGGPPISRNVPSDPRATFSPAMAIDILDLTSREAEKLLLVQEGHFSDIKSFRIAPGKLTRTLSAFANADGGELLVGIEDGKGIAPHSWSGFPRVEDANGHVQAMEDLFPLGQFVAYDFLASEAHPGLVLRVTVLKTPDVKLASNATPYVRRGAQNIPYDSPEMVERLERAKGITSYERATLAVGKELITNSEVVIGFMLDVVPSAEPETWLRKQLLLDGGKPTVAGVLLFADEPQSVLPKAAIKLYRYRTTADEGSRENLVSDQRTK